MSTNTIADAEAAWIKLDLLSQGIEIDPSVMELLKSRNSSVSFRKHVYNSPVWIDSQQKIPQELRVKGLVVGLNSYASSSWRLSGDLENRQLILRNETADIDLRPEIIPDLQLLDTDITASNLSTLYGGAALAFFSPRSCYFFSDGTECRFCSLAGTARESREFKNILSGADVAMTVRAALETDGDRERIEQVMIVGGNMRDLDRGFKHHLELASAAADEVEKAGLARKVSIHVATMPPRDRSLIAQLGEFTNIHVMFNLEVWNEQYFVEIAPGKQQDYGRDEMLRSLEVLRDTIGAYRAHTLLLGGLDDVTETEKGIRELAELGISPIINIYHSDRHSRLGLGRRPSFAELSYLANALQDLYDGYPVLPYWRNCGRNAIDAEASRGLFKQSIPAFLQDTIQV